MLTLVALLVLTAFSGAVFWAGRRRAGAIARGSSAPINSRPGHHGAYAAVWTAAPAALVLILVGFLGDRVEESLVESRLPAVVRAMEAAERQVFLDDAISLARGQARSETPYAPEVQAALEVAAAEVKALEFRLHLFSLAAAAVLALAGASWGLTRIRAAFRAREGVERWVKGLLLACSVTAVFTTVGIVASLVWESWRFFQAVPLPAFLFGLEWDPQSAMYADQVVSEGAFGAIPLFAGTFLIMLISMTVAAPVGLFAAIYLSEYASARTRSVVKPLLEVLAGVPIPPYQGGQGGSNPKSIFNLIITSYLTASEKMTKLIIHRQQREAQYYSENLGEGINLDMMLIPSGSFQMGTPDQEIERLCKEYDRDYFQRESPQHTVNISAFFMGRYPITQAQWRAIAATAKIDIDLELEPSYFKEPYQEQDRWTRPVEQVNWEQATEFCKRLSRETKREYRLPSEAEWEYACRAGTTTPFYFGETITGELANYDASNTYAEEAKGEYRQQTTPVGQFPPNAFIIAIIIFITYYLIGLIKPFFTAIERVGLKVQARCNPLPIVS